MITDMYVDDIVWTIWLHVGPIYVTGRLDLCQVTWSCFSCDCVHYFFVRVFTFCSYILLLVIATCSLRVTCGGSLQNAMQINSVFWVLYSIQYDITWVHYNFMFLHAGGLAWRIRNRACIREKKITSVPFAVYDRTLMHGLSHELCPHFHTI